MDNQKIKEYAITLLYIAVVVALGLFILNQFLSYFYKGYLLYKPCDLCEKLNNGTHCLKEYIYNATMVKVTVPTYNLSFATRPS